MRSKAGGAGGGQSGSNRSYSLSPFPFLACGWRRVQSGRPAEQGVRRAERRWPKQASGAKQGGWSRRWSGRQQSLLLLSLFLPLFGMRVAKGAERPTSRAGCATAGLFPFLACGRRAQRRVCLTSLIVNTRNLYP